MHKHAGMHIHVARTHLACLPMHLPACMHVCTSSHAHMHAHTRMRSHTCTYICMHACKQTCARYLHAHTHARTCTRMHVGRYICMHIWMGGWMDGRPYMQGHSTLVVNLIRRDFCSVGGFLWLKKPQAEGGCKSHRLEVAAKATASQSSWMPQGRGPSG